MSVEQTLTPANTPEVLNRPLRLLIDGEWAEGTEQPLSVIDPSTGELLAESASAGLNDVDRAVAAARRAFDEGPWPAMSPAQRARLIWKLAEAIEDAADELALLLSRQGSDSTTFGMVQELTLNPAARLDHLPWELELDLLEKPETLEELDWS